MKEENRFRRALALALTALLLLALVPILLVGGCAHPSSGDLALSRLVHRAAVEGTSVLGALAATVGRNYLGWDGSFASVALSALQPGLLAEGAYVLTPVLLLAALILSTAALTYALLRRWLGLNRWSWLCVTAGLLLVTVLHQPSPRDAFLLWSSGADCTVSFSLALLLFTCLIRLRLGPKHPRALLCAALLLAVLTGGGDPIPGLLTGALLTGYALCTLRDRKWLPQVLPVWAVFLACLLINVLSPGSGVARASAPGLSPVRAVHMALLLTWPNTQWNLHLTLLALLVGLVPLLREVPRHTSFSFPYPGLVTGAAALLAVLQNALAMYIAGVDLSPAAMNATFNTLPWLLLLTEGYWVGWFTRRRAADAPRPGSAGPVKAALLIGSIGLILSAGGSAPAKCLTPLTNGSARAFDAQVSGWVQVLSDPQADPVELTQLTMPPFLLYDYSLADDPENYINTTYADYYGKTSVIAYPPEG